MSSAIATSTARESASERATEAPLTYRPVPPPPTRRRELRHAAAVQAAWLADLR